MGIFVLTTMNSKLARCGLTALLCFQLGGCATPAVLSHARGSEEEGGKGTAEKPNPAYYLLLPVAVPVDIALIPVGGVMMLIMAATGNLPRC